MSEQPHQSDPQVLNRRSLGHDHRHLADLLRPGMAILDLGCGTGAITAGIARAVGPSGEVLGMDCDSALLALARRQHGTIANLTFEYGDALTLALQNRFDIVTASRTLQWISQPGRVIAGMKLAAKPGGKIVVLDYNHENHSWEPDPPLEFRSFYQAFLAWRTAHQWDNRVAGHLHSFFAAAGLTNIQVDVDDETVHAGDVDFFDAAAVWTYVIRGVGAQMVAAGVVDESQRMEAEIAYRHWMRNGLRRQTLEMRTVIGDVR